MRPTGCNLFSAIGVCVLLALPPAVRADEPEAIPPWGRALAESAPAAQLAPSATDGDAEAERGHRAWARVEYLLWWTRNGTAPPLITKGELTDARPGALDQQYTKILYGGDGHEINFQDRHGGRFTVGVPLDSDGVFAVEANYLFLTARAVGLGVVSPGNPILAQPFFDTVNNAYDSSLASYPGLISGTVSARSASFLHGGEVNGTGLLWAQDENSVTLLAGLRYLGLHEDLQVTSTSDGVANSTLPALAGATFLVQDHFSTWSNFVGGQVGMSTEWHYRRLQLNLLGKVAVGDTVEVSHVAGHTVTNYPAPANVPAGLLALASNSGSFTRNSFTVVPEVGVSLGFRVTDWLTLSAGYTFIYWSDVARPGNQVDIGLNPNLIPTSTTFGAPGGPARPAPGIHGTDYWAQGVSVGVMLRY